MIWYKGMLTKYEENGMKKNRIIAVLLAGTVTASALLAGTYAWRSMNQQAKNEALVQANPGGRLHDDFNGLRWNASDSNLKNVYVENFTGKKDGARIYARIRLDEYLELGSGAGKPKDTPGKTAAPIMAQNSSGIQMEIGKKETWEPYKWDQDSLFRRYVTLNTGGKTIYLPTYNKNQDSMDADINGTLAGLDGSMDTHLDAYEDHRSYEEGIAYSGVEIYTADEDNYDEISAAGLTTQKMMDAIWDAENQRLNLTGNIYDGRTFSVDTVTCTITSFKWDIYSNFTNFWVDIDGDQPLNGTQPDGADIEIVFLQEDDYHKGQQTLETEKFISMTDWQSLQEDEQVGSYWVYDTADGWVYWASPIEPETATGCLINSITCANQSLMSGDYYYGLNVVAQFATVEDVCDENGAIGFCGETVSADAKLLLTSITNEER